MKTIRKRKKTRATYKGWSILQIPWNGDYGFQTTKVAYDETGEVRFHVSYGGKALNHKQLRLYLMELIPFIAMLEKDIKND